MASGAGGGGGAQSGAGGSGGAPAWLEDPGIWTAVAGGDVCGIAVLAVNQPGPAPRSWSSCGPGCMVAAATNLPGETGVGRTTASAGVTGGTAYLRVLSGSPQYRLLLVTRLTDGGLIAAVKAMSLSSCGLVASEQAVLALPFMLPGQMALVGVVNPAAKAVSWSSTQPGLPLVTHVFANDAGWGMQFDDGSIRVLMPPKYPALTTIDNSVVPTGQGAGLLDRMIWSSAEPRSDPEVVKGFTLTAGVKVLAAQATNNHTVAFSDSSVVWIGTTGPQRHEGNYETAQLFWAAWPDPLGPAAVQTGPSLPTPYGLLSLATAGDYAATIGCAQSGLAVDTCELFVVQLTTSKLWRMPRRPGGAFMDVMAVTSDEIVLSEIDFPNGYPQVIQRFVRLGLAHLDEMATAR